jgi:hypothetical protein
LPQLTPKERRVDQAASTEEITTMELSLKGAMASRIMYLARFEIGLSAKRSLLQIKNQKTESD